MRLLIDIGNTNTSIALIKGEKIRKKYFIRTSREKIERKALKRLLAADLCGINRAIIVSVVPKFRGILKKSLRAIAPQIRVQFIGIDIKVPIKNGYKKPREVGQDRLVTSFAAQQVCGSPVLIIDFGTAVTFDLVSGKGIYEGGLIFPGLRMGLKSLVRDTALLPKIEVKVTRGLIGRDTRGSMNKGILFGYAAVCDGLVKLFKKRYGRKLKVVATGGDAGLVARYTRHVKTVHPDLIFTGLRLLSSTRLQVSGKKG